jgi:predicted AAA+ superfamily ATPase
MHGNDIFTEFKGALTEQFVLQELIASGKYTPYYYSGEKSVYETDFVVQMGKSVLPIEIKAEQNLRSKSLKYYYEKFKPPSAVRTSISGAADESWMVNIPIWAIGSL